MAYVETALHHPEIGWGMKTKAQWNTVCPVTGKDQQVIKAMFNTPAME